MQRARDASACGEGNELITDQISLVLGENFLLTFQNHPGDCLDPVRAWIRAGKGSVVRQGPDFLAYCIVDSVIDAYKAFDTRRPGWLKVELIPGAAP